jgi:hypothetical protein
MKQPATYQLTLSLDDINTILKSLGKQPFEEVYGLIHSIHQQVSAQSSPGSETPNIPTP